MLRRLFLMLVTGALMSAVLFAQPASAQQTQSDPFVTEGTITEIDDNDNSIFVEEDLSDPLPSPSAPPSSGTTDKGTFRVTEETEILRLEGDETVPASFEDLSVGQLVEGTYAPPLGAAYPSAGDAERIVILEESSDSDELQPQCFLPEGCFLSGDSSSEKIVGGIGPDYIVGGGEDDALHGLGGGGWLDGGAGDDLVRGNEGDDLVDGGSGNDLVRGNDGNDYVSGFIGNDILKGGGGSDFMYVADGWFDEVSGGPGYDVCVVVDWFDEVRGCEEVSYQ